jgi:peroxiredoxin
MPRCFAAALLLSASLAGAQSVAGLWDATIVYNNLEIPFRIQFAGSGDAVQGWFFNGDDKIVSTAGRLDSAGLSLRFDDMGANLEARLDGGALAGTYTRRGRTYPFRARPHAEAMASATKVPPIAGVWEVALDSSKGEKAWHLIVRQSSAEVSAAILRVDGDTGLLTGTWRDGKFVLSHFSGARPSLVELTPAENGSLMVVQNANNKYTAWRPAEARAKGLPEPTDPAHHTTVKDPNEPFHFRAPDLNGRMVSDADTRFRDKVVIVAIGGSWCPNCHDEAPFLVELYRKYHQAGLEIVALSFEDEDQLTDPVNLRAFIRKYGIEYTVLLAGKTADLEAKVPQAVNLNAYPTSFFLGRDGRVREVHAGFAGKATGDFYRQLREEVTGLVERLLAENGAPSPTRDAHAQR